MSAVIDKLLRPESGLSTRLFFLAKRFVAGERIETALDAVRELNAAGIRASLDFLGEDVVSREEAQRTKESYVTLLDAIRLRKADANVSVKLTAMGLLFDEDLALANLNEILDAAAKNDDPFVRIDMEGSIVTARTLGLFERAYAERKNVGPVIQAYLKRSPDDVERMIELGARVRLCKGAYSEPAEIAYKDMPTIRREFIAMAETLLTRGAYPGIATHDERIIEAVQAFARGREISKDSFEFQLLFGVKPELQRQLVRDGYRVRVYVPFGTHWAAYFYRRVAERRENALFALTSMFTK
jgi:proline dehydrogenase